MTTNTQRITAGFSAAWSTQKARWRRSSAQNYSSSLSSSSSSSSANFGAVSRQTSSPITGTLQPRLRNQPEISHAEINKKKKKGGKQSYLYGFGRLTLHLGNGGCLVHVCVQSSAAARSKRRSLSRTFSDWKFTNPLSPKVAANKACAAASSLSSGLSLRSDSIVRGESDA